MATPDSIKAAREAVESIATQHGHVGQDKLQQIQPELRREIEKALFSKDQMIEFSVITLAKNLYSSKARFVFELLQNADDNKYTKASSLGSKPFVFFRIFPRKIVVECNEDGFSQENLEAICPVGQSSKTGAQGYIGEKGIGFNSDFMVAHKIHIQSGPFSFSFGHKPGDSGMGMISPIWEETREELESPLTRITLHLHDAGDQDELAKTRESIQSQFETLQAKVLPFLRNIRRVQIAFYDDREEQTSSVTYDLTRLEPSHVLLKKIKTEKAASEESIQYFPTCHYTVQRLAKNENGTYSKSEEASRAYSKSGCHPSLLNLRDIGAHHRASKRLCFSPSEGANNEIHVAKLGKHLHDFYKTFSSQRASGMEQMVQPHKKMLLPLINISLIIKSPKRSKECHRKASFLPSVRPLPV
ncbi:hypothetical protein CSIM01_09992 [Colletotrichum simmondsii]|uniref:Uncharacterized protein n=1 Tax=Colletotrichum simmondsii TaxID=703756 RepID=A0A135RNC2_9PEZI|nr:hypothetical protein CSIM01_09992 [Colletotrichum simmondsii]